MSKLDDMTLKEAFIQDIKRGTFIVLALWLAFGVISGVLEGLNQKWQINAPRNVIIESVKGDK